MTADGVRLSLQSAWHSSESEPVLGPIDLCVGRAETVAITGPSGVGKTTLLRVLSGLHAGYRGKVTLGGRLGMVFQEPVLLPWRTALQNLTLTAKCTEAEARQMMARVGLSGREGDFPGHFSLGQQRRLALARAFLTRPAVLIMDEPFVSLNTATANDMMSAYEDLRRDTPLACLIVTHDLGEAQRLADRVLVLTGHPAQLSTA